MPPFRAGDLAAWTGGVWRPGVPAAVEGISHDTRVLQKGNLYVALVGKNQDGHAFVGAAFARGACGAVVSRAEAGRVRAQPEVKPDSPLLETADSGAALRDMARGYRRKIGLEVVGVTGSAGKSTVKEMIADALSPALATARTSGNWNNEVGCPLSLLNVEAGTRVGVLEAGTNHPGEMAALCSILEPDWGVVTNIAPVHIGNFGSLEAIAEEKSHLLRCLPRGGTAVLPADDPFFGYLRSASPCRVLTVALEADGDYRCCGRDPERGEARIREAATGEEATIRLRVPGEHNVRNALFAVAVARAHGVPWDAVCAALEGYRPLPMRWQEERVVLGAAAVGRRARTITVVNDAYNANPLSMRAALRALAESRYGRAARRWVVLGGMLELGSREGEEHRSLGRALAEILGAGGPGSAGETWGGLVTVGDMGSWIAEGAREGGLAGDRIAACEDCAEAARVVRERVRDGDVVLLKASRGMRLEEVAKNLNAAGRG